MMRRVLPALLATGLTFLCFVPAIFCQFVNFDDDFNITRNYIFRGFTLAHLRAMFLHCTGHYQPLTWLSFALDYSLWGMDARGYHLTNVVLHSVNAGLVYLLALELLGWARVRRAGAPRPGAASRAAAVFAALVYALHPLRVESVAWATERRDVLSGLFCLGSVLAYLAMVRRGGPRGAGRWWYVVSLALFFGSLLSKAISLTLPAVLFVMDVRLLGRARRDSLRTDLQALAVEKLPYLVLVMFSAILAYVAQENIGSLAPRTGREGLAADLLLGPFFRLVFYLAKMLWPHPLLPHYTVTSLGPDPLRAYVLATLSMLALTAVVLRWSRRMPHPATVWICFVILMFPFLGAVQVGVHFAADRYTYLGAIPPSLLFGGALRWALVKWKRGTIHQERRTLAGGAALALVTALAALTVRQERCWKSSLALWNHTLAYDQTSAAAFTDRGVCFAEMGERHRAIGEWDRALAIDPGHTSALINRSNCRLDLGDFQGALEDTRKALALSPDFGYAYVNQGRAEAALKHTATALACFDRAVQLMPDAVDAHLGRAELRDQLGDHRGALEDIEAALAVWPDSTAALHGRGVQKWRLGDLAGALRDLDAALAVGPEAPEILRDRNAIAVELAARRGPARTVP